MEQAMRNLFIMASAAIPVLLLTAGPASATIVAGDGYATVTAGTIEDDPGDVVYVFGGLATSIMEDTSLSVLRFQFVRPDSHAVCFAVWSVPYQSGYHHVFKSGETDVNLLYYEKRFDSNEKLFVMDEWGGAISIEGAIDTDGIVYVDFDCNLRDYGPDEEGHTADDMGRGIENAHVEFDGRGDLSEVEYYEYQEEVYFSGDVVVLYDDGCYYSDFGDESSSSEEGDYSGSCDSGSSDDDEWEDDDDGWDSGGDSDDSDDSEGDDWEGDDWYMNPPGGRYRMGSMSWAGGTGMFLRKHSRAARHIGPLVLVLLILLGLRGFSTAAGKR